MVLEAMAAGLPVICLKSGGPALAVDHDCGVIVPMSSREETISALGKAVESYLENPNRLHEHSHNAISRVKNEYKWDNKAQEMMKIYSNIVSEDQLN